MPWRRIVLACCLPILFGAWTHGYTVLSAGNANSSLGLNLSSPACYASPNPFANQLLCGSQYYSYTVSGSFNSASSSPAGGMTIGSDTGEESTICLDANGWPTSLSQKLSGGTCSTSSTFNAVEMTGLISQTYASGNYDVYYPASTCNLIYTGDVTSVTRGVSSGHDVIAVTPSTTGILILITSTGAGASQCKNISLTYSADTAGYLAGNCRTSTPGVGCFRTEYVTYIQNSLARQLRFMDWMCTNNNGVTGFDSVQSNWANRPNVNFPFFVASSVQQSIACGVPAEYLVALLNATGTDGWFNIPSVADAGIINGQISGTTLTVNSVSEGFVEVGQTVYGASAGTVIQSGSGTTWTVNNSQSVSATTLTLIGSTYATGLATVIKNNNTQSSNLHTVMEQANEVWNGSNGANDRMKVVGNALWACGLNLTCSLNYEGFMLSQVFGPAWKAVLTSNTVVSAGEQIGNTGVIAEVLSCPLVTVNPCTSDIGAYHSAPYYGGPDIPSAVTAQGDGGVGCFFYWTLVALGTSCPLGPIPDGNGANTTGGISSAFTLSSGQSLTSVSNGTMVQGVWNATPSTNATLAVDTGTCGAGCTGTLFDNNGGAIGNAQVNSGGTFIAVWTNATSAGSVTAGWRVLYGQSTGNFKGSWVLGVEDSMHSDYTYMQSAYPSLVYLGYEGGPGFTNPLNVSVLATLYNTVNNNSLMVSATTATFQYAQATAGMHNLNYFQDLSYWSQFGYWGLCPGPIISTQPTCAKLTGFENYNTTYPKMWTFPFLLKRDLDPAANDNSPAFLDKAA